jgi:hypothetical protein
MLRTLAFMLAVDVVLGQNGTFLTKLYADILGKSYQVGVLPLRNGSDVVDVTFESDPYALLSVVGCCRRRACPIFLFAGNRTRDTRICAIHKNGMDMCAHGTSALFEFSHGRTLA